MTADSTSGNSGPGRRVPRARRPSGRQPHRNRLLLRDLDRFPDLAATMRDQEIQRMYHAATRWLAAQADPEGPERDWPALAAVLAGAISISWLLCDGFGEHPAGIAQDRYVAALAELAAALLDGDGHLPTPNRDQQPPKGGPAMIAERTLESVTGERMVIQESTPDVLRFERHPPPKQRPAPKVAHPTQAARIKVLDGRLHTTVGDQTRDYRAGESFTVPAGTFHSAQNLEAQPARMLVEFSPAEGLLEFFEEMMGLTSMNLLAVVRVIKHHRDAVRLPAPYAQIVGLLGVFLR